jgi:hypothetical protein
MILISYRQLLPADLFSPRGGRLGRGGPLKHAR